MKPAGITFALLLSALPAVLCAAEPTAPTEPSTLPPAAAVPAPAPPPAPGATVAGEKPTVPDALSADAAQKVTALLPKFSPPPPEPAKVERPLDPDVVELPKMTVTQKKRPRLGDAVMMGPLAFNEKLAKEKLSSFDRDFLNKFTLPSWFGGVSAADRAREEYNREKKTELINDVQAISKAVEAEDPAQAKALRDAAARP